MGRDSILVSSAEVSMVGRDVSCIALLDLVLTCKIKAIIIFICKDPPSQH